MSTVAATTMRVAANMPQATTSLDEHEIFPWLSRVEQKIDKIVQGSDVPVVVVLEGGHFDPNRGADDFACYSLRAALHATGRLVKRLRGTRIVLGVLIDDLGMNCNAAVCDTATRADSELHHKELPETLEDILASCAFVKRKRVLIQTERNARNRGLNALKRLLKSEPASWEHVLRYENNGQQGTIYLDTDDGSSAVIARHQGTRWAAQCPLIMGQHYSDVVSHVKTRFPPQYNIIIVDFSEHYDRNKVNRGSELALRLLTEKNSGKTHIINVFLSGLDDPVCIVDEHFFGELV